jgi:hypothetical protein
MQNFPYWQVHIASGQLKIVMGKDCYPNGTPVDFRGPKSRKQLIEEYHAKNGPPDNYRKLSTRHIIVIIRDNFECFVHFLTRDTQKTIWTH